MADDETLRQINTKLAALLAISVDDYLRSNPDVAKPRPRTIDQMLYGVGVPVREIAALLGKSEQAVRQQLDKSRKNSAQKKSVKKATPVPSADAEADSPDD